MRIKVIVQKGEDGYYVAHCPALKSCWSQGNTKSEAVENIREAVELFLDTESEIIPSSSDAELVELV